ncbi:MAG: DUF1707 SHOCT-like domain-containing protein [Acidimicrobiales bacterium]
MSDLRGERDGDTPRSRVLVGETGRRYAEELLKRAFASGQMSHDEMDRRLDIVYSARVRGDLRPAIEDLPDYQRVRSSKRLQRFWTLLLHPWVDSPS